MALAHRQRQYGASMIYLKLRQEGLKVNHKRLDRLYALADLFVFEVVLSQMSHAELATTGTLKSTATKKIVPCPYRFV